MKFPPLFLGPQCRRASFGLFAALTLALACAGCSSGEPPSLQVQPSTPGGPAAPGGESSTPDGTDTYGSPGPDPVSVPPENDGPGATETNFLTPPCRQDSDCPDGRRCVGGARPAGADGGAADAGDAGLASDAGVGLGFCEPPDAG